ncbi:unnamed protein product, partial [Brassica oleracea var. botrytis]
DSTSALSLLRKVATHSTIYNIWRQRNNQLHNQILISASTVFRLIDRDIRNTLLGRRSKKNFRPLLAKWLINIELKVFSGSGEDTDAVLQSLLLSSLDSNPYFFLRVAVYQCSSILDFKIAKNKFFCAIRFVKSPGAASRLERTEHERELKEKKREKERHVFGRGESIL